MSVYSKLNQFKKIVGKVRKDANNPFHKSKYSTIESVLNTIEEPLSEVKLGFYQYVDNNELVTVVYDEDDSDTTLTSRVPLILSKQDMQQLGSAITYARRYGLVSMFGLEQEDDDGNRASGYKKPQQQTAAAPKEFISKEQAKSLNDYAKENNTDIKNVLSFFKVDGLLKLTVKQYTFAMNKIKAGDFK